MQDKKQEGISGNLCSSELEIKEFEKLSTMKNFKAQEKPLNSKKFKQTKQFDKMDDGFIQIWEQAQIKKLFELYNIYGPQWKCISECIKTRSGNSLKNRFYTTLRNLLKLLFRTKKGLCPKIPYQIPSKQISRIYDAKQSYQQFDGFLKLIIAQIDYNLSHKNLNQMIDRHAGIIQQIFKTVYKQKINEAKDQQQAQLIKGGANNTPAEHQNHDHNSPSNNLNNVVQPNIENHEQPMNYCFYYVYPWQNGYQF